ncbi:hypothetical protein ADUPG1_007382, partial [Aduncisulcus paluster]
MTEHEAHKAASAIRTYWASLGHSVAVRVVRTTEMTTDPGNLVSGYKADEDKVRMDLLPPEFLFATAQVLTFGANKYAARNWEKGMKWSRPFGAMMRHMWAWWAGRGPTNKSFLFGDLDPETNMSHLWHAACCVAFLISYEARGIVQRVRLDSFWRQAAVQLGFAPDESDMELTQSQMVNIMSVMFTAALELQRQFNLPEQARAMAFAAALYNLENQALAYRIWGVCDPIGWDCTVHEIAAALGENWRRVNLVLNEKGWSNRIRATPAKKPAYRYEDVADAIKTHFGVMPDKW